MIIETYSTEPVTGSRGFPWPVLEAGNGSYPDGIYRARVTQRERGRSFDLCHEVNGATLIEAWKGSGKVVFACAVASPESAYRQLATSDEPAHPVTWNPDDLGSHPLFTPMIVCAENITHRVNAERDSVNPMWDGVELRLVKGSRLALCHAFALQAGLIGLLDFRLDTDLDAGQFRIDDSTAAGFRFKVNMARDLHSYLHSAYNQKEPSGSNVMTHIVSSALSCLQRHYSDDEGEESWKSHRNLEGLANYLADRELPHWSDENFRPEKVATVLHPHKLSEGEQS